MMKEKVFACVTRSRDGGTQVLTFTHRDYPEAGVQVPGGSVDPNEELTAAVWRELREEAGLLPTHVRLVRQVSSVPHPEWDRLMHIFHFAENAPLPDTWSHTVFGAGDDVGLVFEYRWLDLLVPLDQWTHRVPPWLEE